MGSEPKFAEPSARRPGAVLEMGALSVVQRHQLGMNGRTFAQKEFGRTLLIDRLEALLLEAADLYEEAKVKP